MRRKHIIIGNEINISFNYDKSFLGSPIINIANNKFIGILFSSDKGITLKYILEEYFMNHNNAFIIDNSMNNFQQMNLMINPLEYQMEQYQIAQQQIYYQKYMNEIKFKNQIKIKFKVNSDFRKTNNEIKFF